MFIFGGASVLVLAACTLKLFCYGLSEKCFHKFLLRRKYSIAVIRLFWAKYRAAAERNRGTASGVLVCLGTLAAECHCWEPEEDSKL